MRKYIILLLFLGLSIFYLKAQNVLYIAGQNSFDESDSLLYDSLVSWGYNVTWITGDDIIANDFADTTGQDVIVQTNQGWNHLDLFKINFKIPFILTQFADVHGLCMSQLYSADFASSEVYIPDNNHPVLAGVDTGVIDWLPGKTRRLPVLEGPGAEADQAMYLNNPDKINHRDMDYPMLLVYDKGDTVPLNKTDGDFSWASTTTTSTRIKIPYEKTLLQPSQISNNKFYPDLICKLFHNALEYVVNVEKFSLTVLNGSGGGEYVTGQAVNISAATPPGGMMFDVWTGDVENVTDTLASTTTLTMPDSAISISATFKAIPLYTLTVNEGTGGGDYPENEIVTIIANEPETGFIFKEWTGETDNVTDVYADTSTLTMPDSAIAITATYIDETQTEYMLTVENGSGDGEYFAGREVTINANAPLPGQEFEAWTGDVDSIRNVHTSSTTIVMPAKDVAITATYSNILEEDVITGLSTDTITSENPEPRVRQLYMVAPNILALRIDAEDKIMPGMQIPYVPEASDVISLNGYLLENTAIADLAGVAEYGNNKLWRKVIRDGKQIGYLAGHDEDLAQWHLPIGDKLDETWADASATYEIISADDANYASVVYPENVFRKTRPRSNIVNRDWGGNYTQVHEIYLELPSGIQSGKTYQLSFSNNPQITKDITFTFDATRIRSEAIQVNQNGYAPQQEKLAFLSTWMGSGGGVDYSSTSTFHVYDESNNSVFQGSLVKKTNTVHSDNLTNTDVYEMNFSALQTPGKYRVVVPGIGSSFEFEINKNVWLNATKIQMMGVLHQRAGIEVNTLPTPHPEDLTENQGFTVYHIDKTIFYDNGAFSNLWAAMQFGLDRDSIHHNVYGGWRDALDFDRQPDHMEGVGIICNIWESNPEYFENLELPLPGSEATNNIPDVIDEARWCADLFLREQTPDGEIPSYIESIQHPRAGESQWNESLPGCWVPGRHRDAMNYAGNAAYLSWVLENYDTTLARQYEESALLAYQWVLDNPNDPSKNMGVGMVEYGKSLLGAVMYRKTGQEDWHTLFKDNYNDNWQYTDKIIYINTNQPGVDATLQNDLRDKIIADAEAILDKAPNTVYESARTGTGSTNELTWPKKIGTLVSANMVDPNTKYIRAIENAYLFAFGANPKNATYISGIGIRDNEPDDMNYKWGFIEDKPIGLINPGYEERSGTDDRNINDRADAILYPNASEWPDAEFFFPSVKYHEHTVQELIRESLHGYAAVAQHYGWINDSVLVGTRYELTVNNGLGSGNYDEGYAVTITANAAPENQIFDKWIGDTGFMDDSLSSSAIVIIPARTVEITATYKERPPEYQLTVEHGSGDSTYFSGSVATFKADPPAKGFVFDTWTGDTASVADIYAKETTLVMPDSAITVTATFKNAPPATLVKAFAFGGNDFTIPVYNDPNKDYTKVVIQGQNYLYSAQQGHGYTDIEGIDEYLGVGDREVVTCEIYDQFIGTSKTGEDIVFRVDVPNGDYKFVLSSGDVAWGHLNTIIAKDGSDGDSIILVDNVKLDAQGKQQAIVQFHDKVVPPCDDVNFIEQPESPTLTVTNGYIEFIQVCKDWWGGDMVLLEIWDMGLESKYSLDITASNGSVSLNPAGGIYNPGTDVELTAEPFYGYSFVEWSGDLALSTNPTSITMNSNKSVTAVFAALPTYSLTVVNGTGSGHYLEDEVVDISADTPASNEMFNTWTGDAEYITDASASSTSITMPAKDVSVEASYSPTGINDFDMKNIKLYPNPVNDVLVLEGVKEGSIISISTLLGEVLINKQTVNKNPEFNLSSIPPGLYIIQISRGKTIWNRKIMKK